MVVAQAEELVLLALLAAAVAAQVEQTEELTLRAGPELQTKVLTGAVAQMGPTVATAAFPVEVAALAQLV